MHQDLVALLALQVEDDAVSELESRLEAYTPRIEALDKERSAAAADEMRARAALDEAERSEHEVQARAESQKQLHERNSSQLDAVRKPREAAAAMQQAEISRRVLQDVEREMQASVARVVELRARLKEKGEYLANLTSSQTELRADIEREVAALKEEIRVAREKRDSASVGVPRAILHKYDRLRGRRKDQSVFPISGTACGNCDMAVPIHRRNMMSASGNIEVCEACGVLLYIEG